MQIGDKYSFVPACNIGNNDKASRAFKPITGTVVAVNRRRRWFRVRYMLGDNVNHECFKLGEAGT